MRDVKEELVSQQTRPRGIISFLLIVIAFILACAVSNPTPNSSSAFDSTKVALELQNTAMAMQLTQTVLDEPTQPALGLPTKSLNPVPSNQDSTATESAAPALQASSDFQKEVDKYYKGGYLPSTDGEYHHLDDFSMDWSTINLYGQRETGFSPKNFMVKAHFKWRSAIPNPDPAGCGWAFRSQGEDHYLFFVDRETVWLGIWDQSKGGFIRIGRSSGSGWVGMGNPAETDVVLIVNEGKAYVFINDGFTSSHTLDTDFLTGSGSLDYSVLSGTTKNYGTHCDMTNVDLWIVTP